ncbi:MAG: HTH domain-containing protein [Bacteroidales bacterium]|nr:HTH domain-containing protein [Bacteroidales bacterium]MBN2750264.1 HTH domain-containing protein [Bacteroidales bacterium]
MVEQEKIQRTLRLLLLLSGRKTYTISELAEMLSTTNRTIYRYLETFREVGFQVERINGRYSIDKVSPRYKELSSLLYFSPEEAYVLSRALDIIDDGNPVKQQLVEKLYSLYEARNVAATIVKKANSEIVTNLVDAISSGMQVILKDYHSSNSNSIGDRLVEPFGFTYNFLSVWCYDPVSGLNKVFKTSRVGSVIITGSKWLHQKHHKMGHLDHFRVAGYQTQRVCIELNLRAANLLKEEYPLAETALIQNNDGSYVYEADVSNFEGVGRFVLGLPQDVKVVGSQDFIDFLAEKVMWQSQCVKSAAKVDGF